jgi:SAM-dependent MidA family methyltransferase
MIAIDLASKISPLSKITLCELGPGRGLLMGDILRIFEKLKLLSKIELILIENSPILQQKQQKNLQNYIPKLANFTIEDNIKNTKVTAQPFFLIANEFFDALPIKSYIKQNNNWYEQVISYQNNQLTVKNSDDISDVSSKFNHHYQQAHNGDIIEFNYNSVNYCQKLAEIFKANSGYGVIIDYGFFDYQKHFASTIQAVHKHQYHNWLDDCGLADITAHVNFKHLAECFIGGQLNFMTQADYLNSMGINLRYQQLNKNNKIKTQYDRLINEEQMGELFKVLTFKF